MISSVVEKCSLIIIKKMSFAPGPPIETRDTSLALQIALKSLVVKGFDLMFIAFL